MAFTNMKTSTGFKAIVSAAWDENGEKCFTIQDAKSKAYLTCHDDKKHMWWQETDEAWNWEHYYPVKVKDESYKFKTYFDTYFCGEEADDLWQCFELEDVDVIFKGKLPEHVEEEKDEEEEAEEEDEPIVKKPKKVETPENSDTESSSSKSSKKEEKAKKPKKAKSNDESSEGESEGLEPKKKREMSDELKEKMAIGRKSKALFNEAKKEEVEEDFDNLEGKDKTKAVSKKLTEMYKALDKEEKAKWDKKAAKELNK